MKKSERDAERMKRRAAGLAALMQQASPHVNQEGMQQQAETVPDCDSRLIPADLIDRDPDQLRKHIDEEELLRLAESLDPKTGPGQLQEIRVYPVDGPIPFRLVFGERRWRAAKLKGLVLRCQVVPAPLDESALRIAQLGENDNRTDLTFVERGEQYRWLMTKNGWTAAELAKHVHRNPSQISTALSVEANCSPELKAAVEAGTVTERAAYAASQITDAAVRAENEKGLMDRTKSTEDVRAAAKKKPRSKRGRPPAAKKKPPSKVTVATYSEGVDVAGGFRVVVICNGHTDPPGKEAMAAAAEAAAKMFREGAA